MRTLLPGLTLLLSAFACDAETVLDCRDARAELLDSGSYALTTAGERESTPGTAAGSNIVAYDQKLLSAGNRIEAKLGASFGFRYRLRCADPAPEEVEVEIEVLHPPMRNPDGGEAQTRSHWRDGAWTARANFHSGWRFDYDWERVPGEWTIRVNLDGRTLIEQRYEVLLPP